MSMAFIYGFVLLAFLILAAIEYNMYLERKKNKDLWAKIFDDEYDAPKKRPEDLE